MSEKFNYNHPKITDGLIADYLKTVRYELEAQPTILDDTYEDTGTYEDLIKLKIGNAEKTSKFYALKNLDKFYKKIDEAEKKPIGADKHAKLISDINVIENQIASAAKKYSEMKKSENDQKISDDDLIRIIKSELS